MTDPTVKLVMDSFNGTVDVLTREILKTVEKYSNAKEPEMAFHVNRLIRKWFANAGRL